MTEINIPENAGEDIGKGIKSFGVSAGEGVKATGRGLGKGLEATGNGIGSLLNLLGEGGKSLLSFPEKIINLFTKENKTNYAPVFQNGLAQLPTATTFKQAQDNKIETNLRNFIKNVVKEAVQREIENKKLPEKLEDTDNLFQIQKNASETSDSDFHKLWARIYLEEATNPNTISKTAIDICKNLNKESAKALEEDIFPYCTDDGWFVADLDELIPSRIIAQDNDILADYSICLIPKLCNFVATTFSDKYILVCHPGLCFQTPKKLTKAGLEIKRALGIQTELSHLEKINSFLLHNKLTWRYKTDVYPTLIDENDFYIIVEKTPEEKVLYPKNCYKTSKEFFEETDKKRRMRIQKDAWKVSPVGKFLQKIKII